MSAVAPPLKWRDTCIWTGNSLRNRISNPALYRIKRRWHYEEDTFIL